MFVDGGLSGGETAGVVIGVLLSIFIIVIAVIYLVMRNRKPDIENMPLTFRNPNYDEDQIELSQTSPYTGGTFSEGVYNDPAAVPKASDYAQNTEELYASAIPPILRLDTEQPDGVARLEYGIASLDDDDDTPPLPDKLYQNMAIELEGEEDA